MRLKSNSGGVICIGFMCNNEPILTNFNAIEICQNRLWSKKAFVPNFIKFFLESCDCDYNVYMEGRTEAIINVIFDLIVS